MQTGSSFRRRELFAMALAASISSWRSSEAARSDFWNDKDAAEWSESERERLLTNSPWAKRVTPSMGAAGDAGPGFGGGPPGGGPMGGMGRGGPQGGGGGIGGPDVGPGGAPEFQLTVRWESAAPIQMAGKQSITADPDFYLISVSFPGGRGRGPGGQREDGQAPPQIGPPGAFEGGNNPEAAAKTARLEVKGKPPLQAAKAERLAGDRMLMVFDFERAALPITPSTKDVAFSVRMGPMDIKVKFSPKEMMYKGQLSV